MCVFFFNDTATTEIYTLSLHDALPIWDRSLTGRRRPCMTGPTATAFADRCTALYVLLPVFRSGNTNTVALPATALDRKSTRLNSSHANISYAVFCLKKKKKTISTINLI